MEMCLFLILMIFAPLVIPVAILYVGFIQDYLDEFLEARKHGGYKKYKEWKKQKKLEWEQEQERLKAEHEKSEKLRAAFLAGEIQRDDLPRLDGVNEFEFEEEMNLSVDYEAEVREIVYVENEYCESLNDFFIRNKDLRLFHMYKFVYLPNFCKEINGGDIIRYISPDLPIGETISINMDSSYPLQYLWYY